MQLTAKAWNSPPADSKPLSELMKSFGCADVIAPVDAVTFSRRVGELICREGTDWHANSSRKISPASLTVL